MHTAFIDLGGRIGERWATMLGLPGLLYLAGAAAAFHLGGAERTDAVRLADTLGLDTTGPAVWIALLVTVPVLTAAATAAAGALAAAVTGAWLGRWPGIARPLSGPLRRWRRRRWDGANDEYERARDAVRGAPGADELLELNRLASRRNAIALEPPVHPTWMGDRLSAVDARIWHWYGLDVVFAWPRLWLVLNETEQASVRAARARLDSAMGLAGWGLLCLPLALWWWPAIAASAVLLGAAHRRGRRACDGYAHLVEAAFDLRGPLLARELGIAIEEDGALSRHVGLSVTEQLRKAV
ncbi:hypothetical protein [Glycomyces endophyticus]|uniref:hypothetical protein n=1 Tax=Glycomyces endophyticus TaxID=480996 RepID=UPI0031D0083C